VGCQSEMRCGEEEARNPDLHQTPWLSFLCNVQLAFQVLMDKRVKHKASYHLNV